MVEAENMGLSDGFDGGKENEEFRNASWVFGLSTCRANLNGLTGRDEIESSGMSR